MYFDDLSAYPYYEMITDEHLLNVGWLDNNHAFSTGYIPPNIRKKIEDLIIYKECNVMRGFHYCPFCDSEMIRIFDGTGKSIGILGHGEIWVPSPDGKIYIAPTLILHYIDAHHYLPPKEFLDAVETVSMDDSWNGEMLRERVAKKWREWKATKQEP